MKSLADLLRTVLITLLYEGLVLRILWWSFRNRYSDVQPEMREREREAEALVEKEMIISHLLDEHRGSTFLEVGLGPTPNLERMQLISECQIAYTGCDFEDVCKAHKESLAAAGFATSSVRLVPNPVGTYSWSLFELMERGEQFDLIYVDGSHTFYVDLPAFAIADQLLRPGGSILIDDIDFTISLLLQDMISSFRTWRFYRRKYDFNEYDRHQQGIPHIRKIAEGFLIPRLGYKMLSLSNNPHVELRLLQKS